jgi:hypothetical protein
MLCDAGGCSLARSWWLCCCLDAVQPVYFIIRQFYLNALSCGVCCIACVIRRVPQPGFFGGCRRVMPPRRALASTPRCHSVCHDPGTRHDTSWTHAPGTMSAAQRDEAKQEAGAGRCLLHSRTCSGRQVAYYYIGIAARPCLSAAACTVTRLQIGHETYAACSGLVQRKVVV